MPFSHVKRTTDLTAKVLAIIAILIAFLMVFQGITEFEHNKRKTTELTHLLEIVQEQNKRSIEDRKTLHDQNESSIRERRELNKRLEHLEKEK